MSTKEKGERNGERAETLAFQRGFVVNLILCFTVYYFGSKYLI